MQCNLVVPLVVCSRPFVLSEEDEIVIKQLELGTLLESTLSRLCLVIDLGKFLPSSNLKSNENKTTPGFATYHDERFLHPTDGIAREVRIAFWIQRRNELVVTRRIDHHV
jgi:hypothetical protein